MKVAAAGIGIAVAAGVAVFALRARPAAPPAEPAPVVATQQVASSASSRLIVYKSPT